MLATVPGLSSLPGAADTIYLDFSGDTVSSFLSWSNITIPAFDTNGDPSTLTDAEAATITSIWQVAAQAYAPFEINVTTIDPRTISGFQGHVSQIDIGGNGSWTGGTYGGYAQVGGFTGSSASNPVRGFAFPANLGNGNAWYTGQNVVHESGHTFGLNHHSVWSGSTMTNEYSTGPGDGTAPFMGESYYVSRGLWWYGPSNAGPTAYQNDVQTILSDGVTYQPDQTGSTISTAAGLTVSGNQVSSTGILTTMTDVNVWSFTTDSSTVSLNVAAPTYGTLHPKFEVLNSQGQTVVGWDDPDASSVSWSGSLAAGTYELVVESHGVSSLSTSTNYGFDIGRYNVSGTVLTPANYIAAPSNLSATAVSTSQVDLSWTDNASNATGYSVYRSTDGTTWTAIASLSASSTSYADSGLSAGTTYSYHVQAFNASGVSGSSNVASATTQSPVPVPPAAPSGLTVTAINSTTAQLSWVDNSSNESGFLIERSNNGSSWTQIAQVGANVTSYTDSGLNKKKTYDYRVLAFNSGGDSAYSNVVTFPPSTSGGGGGKGNPHNKNGGLAVGDGMIGVLPSSESDVLSFPPRESTAGQGHARWNTAAVDQVLAGSSVPPTSMLAQGRRVGPGRF